MFYCYFLIVYNLKKIPITISVSNPTKHPLPSALYNVRFEVLMALKIEMLFWFVTPCWFVWTSTWHHNPEEQHRHVYCTKDDDDKNNNSESQNNVCLLLNDFNDDDRGKNDVITVVILRILTKCNPQPCDYNIHIHGAQTLTFLLLC
jgi:hypothetical protein